MKKTPKKHVAEQLVSPILEPPVKLSLTLIITGDSARRWRHYAAEHAHLDPSNSQLVSSLINQALADKQP